MTKIFLFGEGSLQSSSSSIASSPTSTESSFLSNSNSENLNPTANWNLNDSLTEPTTNTFSNYSSPSSGSQGSSDGIYEDHPASSEEIISLVGSPRFDEGSLQSSSSSTALSPASTESSLLSSSNSENLNPTANWNLNDSFTEPTTNTFSNYSSPSSGSQGSSDGIYEDHPATSERIQLSFSSGNKEHKGVEYGSVAVTSSVESEEIIASVGSSPSPMPPAPQLPLPRTNRDDEFVLYLEDIMVNEAIWHSIQDEKERVLKRQELSFSSGNMKPVGVEYGSVEVTSRSPVKSEEIISSVGSSPSPMPPAPQLPLPRTNRCTMFGIDIILYYGGTLKNSNANKGLPFEGPDIKLYYTQIDRRLKTLDELKMIVMEELRANPAICNIRITYRMPHEVLKNRINYKYMAIEADKHVKIMFDKLEKIPEVSGIELYIQLEPRADKTTAINGEDPVDRDDFEEMVDQDDFGDIERAILFGR